MPRNAFACPLRNGSSVWFARERSCGRLSTQFLSLESRRGLRLSAVASSLIFTGRWEYRGNHLSTLAGVVRTVRGRPLGRPGLHQAPIGFWNGPGTFAPFIVRLPFGETLWFLAFCILSQRARQAFAIQVLDVHFVRRSAFIDRPCLPRTVHQNQGRRAAAGRTEQRSSDHPREQPILDMSSARRRMPPSSRPSFEMRPFLLNPS